MMKFAKISKSKVVRFLFIIFKEKIKLFIPHKYRPFVRFIFESFISGVALPRSKNKLLILKTDAIGDFVLISNLVPALKKSEQYKNYEVYFLGSIAPRELVLHWWGNEINGAKFVDKGAVYRFTIERVKLLLWFAVKRFQVVIHPTYSREFVLGDQLVKLTGAKKTIGFFGDHSNISKEDKIKGDSYYSNLIEISNDRAFELDRNNEFILKVTQVNFNGFLKFPVLNSQDKKLFTIFLGGQHPKRRWKLENFREVISELLRKTDFEIVLVGGSDCIDSAFWISKVFKTERIINLCGSSSLPTLAQVISESTILLTHDSSALHIAAMYGVKTICLSNGNHYGRFLPYPTNTFPNLICLFPPLVEALIAKKDDCVEELYFNSNLDINKIEANKVMHEIRMLVGKYFNEV